MPFLPSESVNTSCKKGRGQLKGDHFDHCSCLLTAWIITTVQLAEGQKLDRLYCMVRVADQKYAIYRWTPIWTVKINVLFFSCGGDDMPPFHYKIWQPHCLELGMAIGRV